MVFISNDASKPQDTIVKNSVSFVFRFHGKLYYTMGEYRQGGIWELKRDGEKFTSHLKMTLASAPHAMHIRNDKIYLGCYDRFVMLDDFHLVYTNTDVDWMWAPNSIVVINDNEIYIGMNAGYSRISIDDNTVRHFKLDFNRWSNRQVSLDVD